SHRHRQIAGLFMQLLLNLGLRKEVEELRNAFVLVIAEASKDPKAGTTRDRVLWPMTFIVRKLANAVIHARLDDIAKAARRFRQHRAFAGSERLRCFRCTAAVTEGASLGEVSNSLEVLNEK